MNLSLSSPPPTDSFQVVQIPSLAAALAKLNVQIPFEDVMKAVREEDERAASTAQVAQRRAALVDLALQPAKAPVGLKMTTVPRFEPNLPKPTHVDPLVKERRRRLIELTEEAFPDGKVPDPYAVTSLALSTI
ncbi:hypothetical protein C8R44DRAFT_769863 [Mycena epipterygia]|nr:hypothetical protein C8R44DRAFT_769863 [Mycena epipterygia]